MRRRPTAAGDEPGIDLVPLIDCVFLVLLFFVLCGRISTDRRAEQVTVPPAATAQVRSGGLERVVLSLRAGDRPAAAFGDGTWIDLGDGWGEVRRRLDGVWRRAGTRLVGGVQAAQAAQAVLEVRADEALPFRLVQELQAVAADAVDPTSLAPGRGGGRAFIHLDFAAVPPG